MSVVPQPPRPLRVGLNTMFLEPGRISGTAAYTWSLAEELARDEDLELVVYAQAGWVPPRVQGVDATVVRCPSGFRSVVTRVAWEQLRLPRRVAADGIDVLLSPAYVSPLLGRFAKVVTVHDLYYERVPEAVPLVRRWYYRLFIAASVRRCERVLVLSENTRRDLAEVLPRSRPKTRVASSAVRRDLLDPEPIATSIEGPYFLVVASITANKNIDVVAQAALEVRRGPHRARVCVVGEDPYGLLADALVRRGAQDALIVAGEVDDATLAGLYAGSVAVIHPSRYEGFGLPVLEAQALGVPLLSSRGGSLPEVAGAGARYFDHDRPDELVAAMTELLDDPAQRVELVRLGHENVAQYSWGATAAATAEALFEAWAVRHGGSAP